MSPDHFRRASSSSLHHPNSPLAPHNASPKHPSPPPQGWLLPVPAWADGFKNGKQDTSFLSGKRNRTLCQNWVEARKHRAAPEGAPPWWGCPRGRKCDFAHGDDELQGEAGHIAKARAREEKNHAFQEKRNAYAGYQSVVDDEMDDLSAAVAEGVKNEKAQRKRAREERDADLASSFLPVGEDAAEGAGLRWEEEMVRGAAVAPMCGQAAVGSTGEVEGMGPFCSAGAPGAHLRGGKWVYEVEILSTGGSIIQVGWGTSMFRPSEDNGDGVGDDEHSWSYDGNRCKAWHGKDHKYVSVLPMCACVCVAVRICM